MRADRPHPEVPWSEAPPTHQSLSALVTGALLRMLTTADLQ